MHNSSYEFSKNCLCFTRVSTPWWWWMLRIEMICPTLSIQTTNKWTLISLYLSYSFSLSLSPCVSIENANCWYEQHYYHYTLDDVNWFQLMCVYTIDDRELCNMKTIMALNFRNDDAFWSIFMQNWEYFQLVERFFLSMICSLFIRKKKITLSILLARYSSIFLQIHSFKWFHLFFFLIWLNFFFKILINRTDSWFPLWSLHLN